MQGIPTDISELWKWTQKLSLRDLLVTSNPVTHSEPPVPKKHRGIALTPAQQALVFASATGPWCMATFLEVAAATGARRGEVLALAGRIFKMAAQS